MARLPRRRPLVASSLAVLAACAFVACASSPPDNPPAANDPVRFTRTAAAAPGFTNILPFISGEDWRIQGLYLPTDVKGAGKLTGIRFVRADANATAVTCPAVSVRLGHSTLTALGTGFDANVDASSLTTVASGITISIPPGAGGEWFDVPFSTAYEYDGVESLVVDMETPAACSGTITIGTMNAAGRRALSEVGDSNPATYQHDRANGTVDGRPPAAAFLFVGGEDRVQAGVTPTDWNSWPFAEVGTKVQSLQLASDIASGAGEITSVGFEVHTATAAAAYSYTLRMGHTDAVTLTTTMSSNASDWVTLASSVTLVLGPGMPAGSWIWLPMPQGSFRYDGRRNVVIEVTTASLNGLQTYLSTSSRAGSRVSDRASGGSLFKDDNLYHVAFRFKGATVFATRPPWAPTPWVAAGSAGQIQQIVRPVQMGSSGVVDRIALRAGSPTVHATIPIKIYLGQTSKTALVASDTYASNMERSVLAFSGTATIPGGLSRGDWIEYPLTTSFQYDATRSLVVTLMHDSATPPANQTLCHGGLDTDGVLVFRNGNSVDLTGTPTFAQSLLIDVRIGMR